MISTKEKCLTLRNKDFTLGEIITATKLSKTTIYYHIKNVPLPVEIKRRIQEENTRKLNEFNKKRKGRCIPGRVVIKPEGWSNELIFLVSHFMFDGEVQTHSCIYHNRNIALVNRVNLLMEKIFKLQPYNWLNKETGVYRISYHHVELADYIKRKAEELKQRVKIVPLHEKKIFLQAFFDDEGSFHFDKRLVRGFQHNLEILKLIKRLLKDFDIESKIDEKYQEIVVSRKSNLIKFRNKINFSKGIYINPKRKNSIWKKKLEKREILDRAINSYQA